MKASRAWKVGARARVVAMAPGALSDAGYPSRRSTLRAAW